MNLRFLTGILIFGFGLIAVGLIGYNISNNIAFSNPDADASNSSSAVACPADAKACPDGSFVSRTGANCEFAACPTEDVTTENPVSCCNEGDWYNCTTQAEFDEGIAACGRGECAACQERQTANSTSASASSGNVSGQSGLGSVVCAQDAAVCPDGSVVARDPERNCDFPSCSDGSTPESTILAR